MEKSCEVGVENSSSKKKVDLSYTDEKLSHVTILIGGMACASCVQRVEKGIQEIEGVHSASVNLATEKASVYYDQSLVDISQIKEKITSLGYKVIDVYVKKTKS